MSTPTPTTPTECRTFNITLVGLYGTGKTTMIDKLKRNRFVKSYKPSDATKVYKHTVTQPMKDIDFSSTPVKLCIRDTAGLSCVHSNDDHFLQRKSHVLCFIYSYDDADSYECIKYILENNDDLYHSNRVIMVVRNKVDDKMIIEETKEECDKQFKEITSIHEEIMFVKSFSVKSKSQEKVEKMFVKAVELHRTYYGDKPVSKSNRQVTTSNQDKKDSKDNKKSKTNKRTRVKSQSNASADTKNGKDVECETPNTTQCGCIIL